MFVGVARLTLQIPESGSLKAKRQILRRVTDRVKARFNVSVAEVGDNDLWQRAEVALAVVGNEHKHVNEQLEKIIGFVEDMYVAPLMSREIEILSFNDQLYGDRVAPAQARGMKRRNPDEDAEKDEELGEEEQIALVIPTGERSLAEAEGMGAWEDRHDSGEHPAVLSKPHGKGEKGSSKKLSLDEAKAKARKLRNPRDWEKLR